MALNPKLELNPQTKVREIYAGVLDRTGEELAQKGEIDLATAKFKYALAWDPTLDFDPQTKAHRIYLVSQGDKLASQGQLDPALAKYAQAQQLDPEVEITAESWETLCYFGNLFQQAEKVAEACAKAVALREEEDKTDEERWLEEVWRGVEAR